MNERQKTLQLQQHAKDEDEKLLDVFNCVEQLHSADLYKALSLERGEYRFNKVPRPGRTPSRVSAVQLALALPRHVLGCLLTGQPAVPPDAATEELTTAEIQSTSAFDHVAKALGLLTSLCELAFHHAGLRDATLGQRDFGMQLVDAANLALLAVSGPEAAAVLAGAASLAGVQAALDRAAMVPAALRALAFAFTAGSGEAAAAAAEGVLDWQSICEAVLQHPRGAMLLEAGFDAVRTVVLAVRAALVGDTDGDAVYRMAYYAGAAIELLSYMCVTPLFYQRLMRHDPSGAAPLRLVLACLTLHDAPLAAPPFARSADKASSAAASKLVAVQPPYCTEKGEGAAELLAARGFALLLMLSECEEPGFMDQVAQHPSTRRLADHVNNRAAAYIGQVLLRPSTALFPAAPGESQMGINTLRAAELLSDDSNFRAGLIPLLAPTAAHLLASDAASFQSRWCAGPEAVAYHQGDDIVIASVSMAALEGAKSFERAAAAAFQHGRRKVARGLRLGQQLALERAVLLTKLMVNLHVYVEGTCSQELKDAFIKRLLQVLRAQPAAAAQRLQSALHNLQQLQGLLQPYGPAAPPEQQLVSEIDLALLQDLVARVAEALQQAVAPPELQQQQQEQQVQQEQLQSEQQEQPLLQPQEQQQRPQHEQQQQQQQLEQQLEQQQLKAAATVPMDTELPAAGSADAAAKQELSDGAMDVDR